MSEWIIVRDEKPNFAGWSPEWKYRHVQDEHERQKYLVLKITEEVKEVIVAHQEQRKEAVLEELGDVYEIMLSLDKSWFEFCQEWTMISTIVAHYGFLEAEIALAADTKRKTHGGFHKGILLDTDTVQK